MKNFLLAPLILRLTAPFQARDSDGNLSQSSESWQT